jgi:ABC-type polysaccharide/polyol phosphate transport system ATPase subunit
MMRPMATDRAGSPPVLACADLRKSFGDRLAVDGVGFTIGPSETYGLLGPNGAGKTTTISMICGLLVRDGGAVLVDGAPLDVNAVAAKGAVGFVPRTSPSTRSSLRARTCGSSASSTGSAVPSCVREWTRCSRSSVSPTGPTNGPMGSRAA